MGSLPAQTPAAPTLHSTAWARIVLAAPAPSGESPAERGRSIYQRYGCGCYGYRAYYGGYPYSRYGGSRHGGYEYDDGAGAVRSPVEPDWREVFLAAGDLHGMVESFGRASDAVAGFRRECTVARMQAVKRGCARLRDPCELVSAALERPLA